MAGDHTAWWLPGDYDTQEQETQQTKLSEIRGRFKKAVNWGKSSPHGLLLTRQDSRGVCRLLVRLLGEQ